MVDDIGNIKWPFAPFPVVQNLHSNTDYRLRKLRYSDKSSISNTQAELVNRVYLMLQYFYTFSAAKRIIFLALFEVTQSRF
ncbi:MAG: hypothetical protein Q9M24_02900, partial [Mariprofundaceae bacterium]|nr:hypothetical protein [Mariprofundaceae bacterium]